MKIFIANDHQGVSLKIFINNYLSQKNFDVINLGTDSTDSVDYPVLSKELCKQVLENPDSMGIIICGTGIGVSIACNKIKGIRCAKATTPDEAALARDHNDANVLAFSSSIDTSLAMKIIDEFIETPFSGDERHNRRLSLVKDLEANL